MARERISEPDWSTAYRRSKDVPWYIDDIKPKITTEIRELLEDYSNVVPDDVNSHVEAIREKAWAIRSYPCTGLGLFLDPMLPKCQAYLEILTLIKSGATFLDIGCFLGQDLRRLVADGCPHANLYGMDVVNHWEVGYDMFRDRDRFKATYLDGDILSPSAEVRETLEGIVDVINFIHVLHQWDWATQIVALKNIVRLGRPQRGTLAVGFQVGSEGKNDRKKNDFIRSDMYWHDERSFKQMWSQVGVETETKWECEAGLDRWEDVGWVAKELAWMGDNARVIWWIARRML